MNTKSNITTTGSVTSTGAVASSAGVSGTTGTFSGAVSGTTGTFSGAVSGTTGTFSGAVASSAGVSGTTGTFTGALTTRGGAVISTVEETLTIAAAATTVSTIEIPAGARLLSVSCYVSTVIPTATSFDLGPTGGTANLFGNDILVAATTAYVAMCTEAIYAAPTTITVTINGSNPGDTTGRLKIRAVYYLAPSAVSVA